MANRQIVWVLEEMLKHIPEEHPLTKEFSNMQRSFAYSAPELMYPFTITSAKLKEYIPTPTEEWHYEAIGVFMQKSVEELKEMFPLKDNAEQQDNLERLREEND